MRDLDHPNIIKLYEYFRDDESVYLITDLCKGGEVYERIKQVTLFDEKEACRIIK